jgi:nicotinamide riboside transporter PnuC
VRLSAPVPRMSWLLPARLLLFAGVVALLPFAALVRRLTLTPCPVVEAFITALSVIALIWLAWVALWLIE